MNSVRGFPKEIIFALVVGVALCGCSSMPVVGDLFSGSSPKVASADTPQSTLAPMVAQEEGPEKSVYQSKSISEAEQRATKADGWNLPEGLGSSESARDSSTNVVPDVNYVGGAPTIPEPNWNQPSSVLSTQTVPNDLQMGVHRGGSSAPNFSVTTLDGARFNLNEFRGRVVLLDFWRKTCAPCMRAMPKVAQLRSSYSEGQLVVLGINTDERKSTATSFLKKNHHSWPNVHAWSQSIKMTDLYGVKLLPHFVVIDQVGNIQYQGGNVTLASTKVAELVERPSLPSGIPVGGAVASLR